MPWRTGGLKGVSFIPGLYGSTGVGQSLISFADLFCQEGPFSKGSMNTLGSSSHPVKRAFWSLSRQFLSTGSRSFQVPGSPHIPSAGLVANLCTEAMKSRVRLATLLHPLLMLASGWGSAPGRGKAQPAVSSSQGGCAIALPPADAAGYLSRRVT